VWCNDYCPDNHEALVYNLATSLGEPEALTAGETTFSAMATVHNHIPGV
jgi:hypothetical protein